MVKKALFLFFGLFLILAGYFFIGKAEPAEEISWGVNFSQKQAQLLGLDWQAAYASLLDDLGVKDVKLATYWDLIEPEEGRYNFNDLDWQINEAEKRGARILLVIGMKTPRWPECHEPAWAQAKSEKQKAQNLLLEYLKEIVNRYKDSQAVWAWQVENESLFPFGECPWRDKAFLEREINLVKSLDPSRPVIVSDSGEFSSWVTTAQLGDMVSVSLYRRVWSKELHLYITHYWFQPIYYQRKTDMIKKFFKKEVIIGELQAEPWCPKIMPSDCSLKEQAGTMDLEKFRENINFAKETGLDKFYLWGAEWWYWMKEKQNEPEIWYEAKKLF